MTKPKANHQENQEHESQKERVALPEVPPGEPVPEEPPGAGVEALGAGVEALGAGAPEELAEEVVEEDPPVDAAEAAPTDQMEKVVAEMKKLADDLERDLGTEADPTSAAEKVDSAEEPSGLSPLGERTKAHVEGKVVREEQDEVFPPGRPLKERIKAHVDEQVLREPYMRGLTPEEEYAEVEGTEDADYDLRETSLELAQITETVGMSRTERGRVVVERYYPPIEFSKRLAAIYWNNRPKPRYYALMKYKGLPCSKSELSDDVQLYLQKRMLDFDGHGQPVDYTHLTISQLILLTKVKKLDDKKDVIKHLKKHPKKYLETKEWLRAKGYIRPAKKVDSAKKLIEGFEKVVQNAVANLPALDAADPHSFGFNLLTSWRERLGVVVSLLATLEEEEKTEKAA